MLTVELRSVGEITPYEGNPRVNDPAVDAVAASIREFGFRQPIVVDEDGVIVVGHTRWKAAQKLGLEQVPVHVAHDLTPEQRKAFRIGDNRTADLASWDLERLAVELSDLQSMNVDLEMLGFTADELATLIGGNVADGLCDPDEVPEPPDEAVTQRGDLIILGEHRLLCGDSGGVEDVDRLLDGNPVHLVNCDPPYNVRVEPRSNNAIASGLSSFSNDAAARKVRAGQGHAAFDIARGAALKKGRAGTALKHHQGLDLARHPEKARGTTRKMRAKDRPLENDFVGDDAFDEMLLAWFGNASRVLKPGVGFTSGAGTPTAETTRPCCASAGCTSRKRSSGTRSMRF
jgi:hypothetical protein